VKKNLAVLKKKYIYSTEQFLKNYQNNIAKQIKIKNQILNNNKTMKVKDGS